MYIFYPGENECNEIVAVKKIVRKRRKFANIFIFDHLWASKFLTNVVLNTPSFGQSAKACANKIDSFEPSSTFRLN